MPRPHRRPTEADRDHYAAIRAQAAYHMSKALSGAPEASDDLLGRIAWLHVVLGPRNAIVVDLIGRALEQRYSHAQIAGACGVDPDDRDAVHRFMRRYTRN